MERIDCECGANIIKKYMSKHLETFKHQRNIKEIYNYDDYSIYDKYDDDCSICLETSSIFYQCKQCLKKHCYKCNKRIDKCPFCRYKYGANIIKNEEVENEEVENEEVENEEVENEVPFTLEQQIIQCREDEVVRALMFKEVLNNLAISIEMCRCYKLKLDKILNLVID